MGLDIEATVIQYQDVGMTQVICKIGLIIETNMELY